MMHVKAGFGTLCFQSMHFFSKNTSPLAGCLFRVYFVLSLLPQFIPPVAGGQRNTNIVVAAYI
jgi:hypothetical protein